MVVLEHHEMLPAKYFVGQILEDGREVLAYYVYKQEAVILILKSLDKGVDPFAPDSEPSDRYNAYLLKLDNMKADTDLLKEHDFMLDTGCGHHQKNDVSVAKRQIIETYRTKYKVEEKK